MTSGKKLKSFAMKKVASHNSRGVDRSIWIVVYDKVYDITNFLEEHPGGEEILLEYGGKDATKVFEDVVGHSVDARDMMSEYLIGELRQEDRKGLVDNGPKPWGQDSICDDTYNNWIIYLFPLVFSYLASVAYQIYHETA